MDPPRDLTLPRPGSTTMHEILSAGLRRTVGDLFALAPGDLSPSVRSAFKAFRQLAKRELDLEPGRLFGALRRPNVGTPLRILRGLGPSAAREEADPLVSQLVATLALELKTAGAEVPDALLTLDSGPETIVCLGGRFARGPGNEDGAETHPVIVEPLVLALIDDNPLAMHEAHPDKSGNQLDLGGKPAEQWCDALLAALEIVETHLPEVRRELDLVVHQLVPVGYDEDKHLSASYAEAIGTIYLSLHPDPWTMAEAIVHELSHNKLNALIELDPVLKNAFAPLFSSPVRPDPRPLHGVLLAVHAFIPVAEMYRSMMGGDRASPGRVARHQRVIDINLEGADVLQDNAVPTPIGSGVLDEIASWAEEARVLRSRS